MIPCTQEPGRAVARPRTGETPIRHARIGDEIWEQVERFAEQDGTSNTEIVKTALTEYIAKRRRIERSQRRSDA